jgi:D-alanine transaminase
MADPLYMNGTWGTMGTAVIEVEDRGFLFGDGIYEVLKFQRRVPLFVTEHCRRMAEGLEFLGISNPWSEEEFGEICVELSARSDAENGLLYLQVTRGAEPRNHFASDGLQPTAVAYSRGMEFPDRATKEHGIAVITTEEIRWYYCNVKTVNLLGSVVAKRKAKQAGAEEAVFIKEKLVIEGANTNFFGVRDGKVITHPTDHHILPGIVRHHVLDLALSARIRVDERALHENELFSLDEAFVTSTSMGVMPVTTIDGRAVGNGRRGELTGRLLELFDQLEERVSRQGG